MVADSKDDIICVGDLKGKIVSVTFHGDNVREIHQKIKTKPMYKETDLVFLNPILIFGKDHLVGIMKIINEEKKRKKISEIKNLEVEFLLRLCCTDQIKEALNRNFGDMENRDYVILIMSNSKQTLQDIELELSNYGTVHTSSNDFNLLTKIAATKNKRDHILNTFFKDKFKDPNLPILNKDDGFLKFLIERAAIALR